MVKVSIGVGVRRCILWGLCTKGGVICGRGDYAPGGLNEIGGVHTAGGVPSPGRGVKYSKEWLEWVYVSEGVSYGGYALRGGYMT